MKKIKQIFAQLFCTYAGWLIISAVLIVIFGSLSSHSLFIKNGSIVFDYLLLLPMLYFAIISSIMAYYGIKNMIKKQK